MLPASLVMGRGKGFVQGLPKAERPRRPPRCQARSTDPAPLDRQAVPSSSGRFPACPSASPEAPLCPPGSRQSVRECIPPAAPSAPADRRRRPRHKHSVAPTDRWLASADSRPPSRSSAARSPRRKIGRILAEQGRQDVLKVASGNAAHIKSRQKNVEALRAPSRVN